MPRGNPGLLRKDQTERFWAAVELEDPIFPENGCMLWKGIKSTSGYGRFIPDYRGYRAKGRAYREPAHRWIYERMIGPIPEGMQLDHLCGVRHCVNPNHLEPVTARENTLRSPHTLPSKNLLKTHCPRGHEYSGENIRWKGTKRYCRICDNAAAREYQRRKAANARKSEGHN